MLSEKSNEGMRPGRGRSSLRSNSKPHAENIVTLEEQLISPNKNDEIDDDFAELIVNKTNSITEHQRRDSNDDNQMNQMKMSELKSSYAPVASVQY